MEAHRFRVGNLDERLRQNMLAGVVLHMVEAARPVDLTAHGVGFQRFFEYVEHRMIGVTDDHIHDRDIIERSGIVGLAAAGGVEVGLIQNDRWQRLVLRALNDPRFKGCGVRIRIVQALCCHKSSVGEAIHAVF